MEYSVYCTVKHDRSLYYAFSFYNHRGERVYRTKKSAPLPFVPPEFSDLAAYMTAACDAVGYFSRFMRSRYYDEHFATILDEDGLTVYTPAVLPRPAELDAASPLLPFAEELLPYFTRPSIRFLTADADIAARRETEEYLKG